MKKYLLICTLLVTSLAYAQLDKGSKLVGLQTNLIIGDSYATYPILGLNNGINTYGMNLVPTLGWAIERN